MNNNNRTGFNKRAEPKVESTARIAAGLEFDAARYKGHIADLDIPDAQAQELLQTLFAIMRSFVELGFEGDICAQLFRESREAATPEAKALDSSASTTTEKL